MSDFTIQNGVLTRYTGPGGEVIIPSAVAGEQLKEIGRFAFRNCTSLRTVVLPEGLERIGIGAFLNCTGLVSLRIPDSVSEIDGMAFKGCTGLADADGFIIVQGWLYGCAGSPEELMIPAGVTHIQSAAFEKAASLRSVILPEGVVSIGDHAFKDCVNLCTVVLPDSLEKIGDRAFCGCQSLRSVTIPAGVSRVGQHAFARCTSLTSISFPEDAWVDRDVIFRCSGLADEKGFVIFRGHLSSYAGTDASVVIPDSVRSFNPFAFEDCPQITDITFPENGVGTDLPSLLLEHLPEGVRLQIQSVCKENRQPLYPPQKPDHPNK